MFRRVLFFLFLLSSSFLHADRVVFRNGDAITGTVVAWRDGSFEIKSAMMGDVKAPWEAVSTVTTEKPLYVVLKNETVQCGSLEFSDAGVKTTSSDCPERFIEKSAVKSIQSESTEREQQHIQNAGITQMWMGSFDAGLSAARSDASSTNINLGMKAVRSTYSDNITLTTTWLSSRTTSATAEEIDTTAIRAGARYSRNLSQRSFAFAFGNFESDELQLLDLRQVYGSGLGYRLKATDRTRFDVFSGGSYLHEKFQEQPQRTAGELLFGQETAFKFGRTTFGETLSFYPNVTDTGEYRLTLDSMASVSLNSWLSWQTKLSEIYITNPPVGTPGNNFLITTGLRLVFGKELPFKPNAKTSPLLH